MRSARDRFIVTGGSNAYFLMVVLLVTLIGLMYVLGILPAYDPSVLAQPSWLTFVEYLGLAVGGIVTLGSFAISDKILLLKVQFAGLSLQTASALVLATTVAFFGGLSSLFIVVFCVLVSIMHIVRLVYLRRDIRNAPLKRTLAEKVKFSEGKGDLLLQTLVFMQSRNEELEAEYAEIFRLIDDEFVELPPQLAQARRQWLKK